MTWEDIITLLEQGEGQSVEFEKYIPSSEDLARDMVAFANSDGGKIVLGLDDKNKHLVGVEADDSFKTLIKELGEKRCFPKIDPSVEMIARGDKKILVINVLEGDEKPYKTDDICYLRDVGQSRPAKDEEEKQITNPWGGKGLNKRQLRTLQLMQEHESITNREYREAFNVSHKTAHIELTMMADKKIVKSEGSGRSTCYILPKEE
ncbi:MAG: putative transcriptional regulator [Candidatus Saganbacteria bacterium]|uniref:Putative transcriptional regulator n=1 Tax=Candidatus Saganbacteria bacterium TaxID=2575572 RepID=A0A833NYJ1_UNCSA|nr:MAG: putative transcriptional regulator [Candidatus Saganbacteria bacterium]